MFIPSHLKTLNPLQVFSTKSPSSILSCTKMKTLIHNLIVSHLCRFFRALTKVKSIIIEVLRDNQLTHILHPHKSNPHNFKYKKIFFGSFRLHYNWGSTSSHVLPAPAAPAGNSTDFATTIHQHGSTGSRGNRSWRFPWSQSQRTLSGYLEWLEETIEDGEISTANEVDKLADVFIANCHEKFILEKQESDRRFQEMLARGL